jgi:ParB family chromosome partitioning protein
MPTARTVPLASLVEPPEPLRVAMDEGKMAELVESIRLLGIIQPLAVLPLYQNGAGELQAQADAELGALGAEPMRYEIIDGHRRWYASTELHLAEVPVMVFENLEQAKFAVMLHANVCREDVTPFEEGVQFLELATKHRWSMDDMMRFFGQSENYINDRVDIVRKDENVAAAVQARRLNLGQAKEILRCEDLAFRPVLLEQATVHGATNAALRVMRHHHDDELRMAQGQLPVNASEQFYGGVVLPPDECLWCGRTDDLANLVNVKVHQYHQADLKALLEKFGLRALLAQQGGV